VAEPLEFFETAELEYPVELMEPLASCWRAVEGLCARLSARGLATNELRLRLKLEGRRNMRACCAFQFPCGMPPRF